MDERRFSDEEVREILKKAVTRAPSRAVVKSEGLTLEELKSIGREVGIDPGRLEDAARSVVLRRSGRSGRLLGGPTVVSAERKVEGVFDPEETPEILSIIRRTMGQQGETSEVRGSLEWRAQGETVERYVTLSSREGVTTIQGSANLSGTALVTYLPAGMLGLITSLIGLIRYAKTGSEVGLIILFAVLPVLYPILRTIFSRLSRWESEKLERVVDDLARMTEGSPD